MSGPTDDDAFRVDGPLPTGTTLLEASAGTGKTWTIAALVTRYVAEGVASLDELLVVTFTRAASQELRERVREQLVAAERGLAAALAAPRPPAAGAPQRAGEPTGDELVAHLLDADDAVVAERHARLRAAVGAFDGATIATIHQFCQLVLRSLGVAGDTDAEARLVEDLEDLTTEVVDDLYLARWAHAEDGPPFDRGTALAIARAVVEDPRAAISPDDVPDGGSVPAQRVAFARAVLAELERRKRRLGILSYDDLLGQLADALDDQDAPARARMRQRWRVALIDEFQDTDPVQWEVFSRAFDGVATLVLIGDPKQAIYAFRGGDIVTYLRAADAATTRQTLTTNRRSDGPLVDRLQVLFGGARLGDERIAVHPVRAHHEGSRLAGAGEPFRLRVARPEHLGLRPEARGRVDQWRAHVATDMARDIKRLLTSGATFEGRALEAGDVAVLGGRRADLQAAQDALAAVGVPAVVAAGGSVFATPAARSWRALLEALEQPHRADRVRAAALSPFVGRTAATLEEGPEDLTDLLAERMRDLGEVLAGRGVAAVLECAVLDGMIARVLGTEGGARLLTDLRHIGEALHREAVERRLGVAGLLAWLREQMADDKAEVASERTRRLDSDAAAVQLVTIHGSKGLQYPVVYLPTLWDRFVSGDPPPFPRFHDDAGHRCRDVGGPGPQQREAERRARDEEAGETLRLAYVAATRAQSQVVAWWAPAGKNTPASPLHRLMFGRRPGQADVPAEFELPDRDRLDRVLAGWRDAGGPAPEPAVPAELPAADLPRGTEPLAARAFTRDVDVTWRRTSYSALAAGGGVGHRDGSPLSEPEDDARLRDDEPVEAEDAPDDAVPADGPAAGDPDGLAAVPSPMASLPVGAAFGSLVHAVLEHADPAAADLAAELGGHLAEQLVWWPVGGLDAEELVAALVAVHDSPMGPLAGGRTLREVPLADRLRELEFELPLAGGDLAAEAGDPAVRLGQVAGLLRRHLPDDDPLRAYADTLDADPDLAGQSLRGYLTGSIDVVMRVPGADGEPTFVTVDYKTNWLGGAEGELTAHDYRPEALDAAMGASTYPLQALLYSVVLHRYLRWRLPGYDPERHLGGVLYLYLRGMCGPETPLVDGRPCGVFAWRPPTALVADLSDLLDGAPPGEDAP